MWDPWRVTTLWAFTACYRDSFSFYRMCYIANNWKFLSLHNIIVTSKCVLVQSIIWFIMSCDSTKCLHIECHVNLCKKWSIWISTHVGPYWLVMMQRTTKYDSREQHHPSSWKPNWFWLQHKLRGHVNYLAEARTIPWSQISCRRDVDK
jgi:hypothetical protein